MAEQEQVKVLLVPVDGSDGSLKALRIALNLARSLEVPVELLFSFPRNAIEMFGPPGEAPTQNQLQYMSEEAFSGLRNKSAERVWESAGKVLEASGNGLSIRRVLLAGDPSESIIEHSESLDSPMILVGSRGLSRFKSLLLGSVSQRLVQHASCPVTVVH